ncbi:dTDP-glucose 4,6-dehydratase [Methanosphaera sp. ISO3-F5]|uniref:dTDP-glucose 4,6-dehydratase n=1 Tax=Methanosphaera sp. ISO3-F5 TaxID=1452353 RepID=UPI002B261658|nr:dTDP-glucose 4,6-dehydratase [Methanosphaera sp. ISO3-F5]WQH65328.1 dTDP-glucose 4,6-dehydratase [Methanosphaera sp. ISO3-F5]
MLKIMITGGAGFIGSNFVHYISNKYEDYEITVLDKLTYAGDMENLKGLDNINFIKGDIADEKAASEAMKDADYVVNFAAETHVDKSINDPASFVKADVLGTQNLLELVRKYEVEKYIQISTDEVYGSILEGSFKETDNIDPSSPYSASKAGGDLLVSAYYKTYDIPVMITRSSNNFGPRQFPEKLIPLFILKALHDEKLPVYGDGKNVRDWIYVEDNCAGVDTVLHKGKIGEVYNIGGGNEKNNLEITKLILEKLGKPETLIEHVTDRLGHDRRYSLDASKTKKLGWQPKWTFEDAMEKTVNWYKENSDRLYQATKTL